VGFVARELTNREPIVQLRILLNRNFGVGTLIATVFGFALYGVTALMPLFLQTQLGYSALDSGLTVSPRGLGSMLAMLLVGMLVNYVDGRILLACGFAGFGYSTLLLSHINLGISMWSVAMPNFLNGLAGGFIFVPLTTMTMSLLRKQEIGNAAGVYNLMRNIGGSIGIATVTTFLVRGAQTHQNYLAANVTSSNPTAMAALAGLQAKFMVGGASPYTAHQLALGAIYRSIQQQASLLAYADNFRMMGYLSLLCIPLLALLVRLRHRSEAPTEIVGE
jgi:DHA2 family multidrug resistance protein